MVIKVRRREGRSDRPRQNRKNRAARNDQFCVRRPPAAGNRVGGNQILINHNEGKRRSRLGRPPARALAAAAAFLTSLFTHSNVGGEGDN